MFRYASATVNACRQSEPDDIATVSTDSRPFPDMRLFPNPNTGAFTIKGAVSATHGEEIYAEVINMMREVVYRGNMKAENGIVDEQLQLAGNLANGMYLLHLHAGTNSRIFHFVIER